MSILRSIGLSVGVSCAIALNLPSMQIADVAIINTLGLTAVMFLIVDLYHKISRRR